MEKYFDKDEFVIEIAEKFQKEFNLEKHVEDIEAFLTKHLDEYGKIKWEQACKAQIEKCSDVVYDLMTTNDDVETWSDEMSKTETVEYDEEFESAF